MSDNDLSRRAVVLGLPLMLGGCVTAGYGTVSGEPHAVQPLDMASINPALLRQQVSYRSPYKPGTVVVNIQERRLYHVQPGGSAMRYAVGVGRSEGANFRGSATIGRKEAWPHWTPTENMM